MCADISLDSLPAQGSSEMTELESAISVNLAIVMSAGGMECSAEDIHIISIGTAASESSGRRLQEGTIIDYNVVVPPLLATPEIMSSARHAIENPTSVGLSGDAMSFSIGGVSAGAPQAMHFRSYSWVKTAGTCPTQCGSPASSVPDTYSCEEDGIVVSSELCTANLSPILVSQTECPPTDDCACVGAWSICLEDCSDKTYTVSRQAFGAVGNGRPCEAASGDVAACNYGEGQCPAARDCIGGWSPCDWSCTAVYTVHVPPLGTGVPCVAETGDTTVCAAGQECDDNDASSMGDTCTAASECVGRVTVGGSLSYAIEVTSVPIPGSTERSVLEHQLTAGLTAVLTAAGMTCTEDQISIISILAGSLVVDFSASVPPETANPSTMVAAQEAIEDPTAVGLAPDTLAISVNGQSASGATAMHFKSYAWIRTRGICPTDCGIPPSSVPDSYSCAEDGVAVDSALCTAVLGPVMPSTTACPPTNDCECLPHMHCVTGATSCTPQGDQTCSHCKSGFYKDSVGHCSVCPTLPNCLSTACSATPCTWNEIEWACLENDPGVPFDTVCMACVQGFHLDGVGCAPDHCTVTADDIAANGLIGTCGEQLASGSSCAPSCSGGYRLVPDLLDVHNDGVISDSVRATCALGILDMPACEACTPGRFKTALNHAFDTECTVCPEGYTSTAAQSQCSIGLPCTMNLTMPNSPDLFSGITDDVWPLTCDQGYEPQGIHMCKPNGHFEGGRCAARRCTAGTRIANSSVSCAGSFTDECSYMCNCGYSRHGVHRCDIDQSFRGGSCHECPPGHASQGIECSQCAPGYEPDATGCVCEPCPDGMAAMDGVCHRCPPGTAPDDFHTICLMCPLGRISPDGMSCERCDPTSYSTNGINCTQADDGFHPDEDGAAQVPCPAMHAGIGGVCTTCSPGTDPNLARTQCRDCPRYTFNPGGLGCLGCQAGFVPNDAAAATFCVSCSLENEPETAGPRYANTDWFGCLLSQIQCDPGQAQNGDMTGCIECADLGESFVSPLGVRCDPCAPGSMPTPNRASCAECPAGTYSPAGVCSPCAELGANFYSQSGATRCISCGAGTEPTPDRGSCVDCLDGFFSPYGTCMQCDPGKQPDSSRAACESCAAVGSGAFSVNGTACQICADGQEPLEDRTGCTACPDGMLGEGGTCLRACDALGCQNVTLTTTTDTAVVDSLSMLCPRAGSWILSGRDKHVTVGSCSTASCSIEAPVGENHLVAVGSSPATTASCSITIFVNLARVVLSPASFVAESLSTAYADSMMRVENEGDEPAAIYEINFDVSWLSVFSVSHWRWTCHLAADHHRAC